MRTRKPRRQQKDDFQERVIRIDRTRKTVKGGRVSSVRVCAAVGDGRGRVGLGVGKAREIPVAIEKAMKRARENMIRIPMDNYTIPHQIQAKVGGAVVLLRPASEGTGIVAGGSTRRIFEVSGVRDILTKSLGSGNVFNRAHACFKALKTLYNPARIAAGRGKNTNEILGRNVVDPYLEAERAAEEAKAERAAAAAEAKAAAEAEAKAAAQAAAEAKAAAEEEAKAAERAAAEAESAAEDASAVAEDAPAAEEAAPAVEPEPEQDLTDLLIDDED